MGKEQIMEGAVRDLTELVLQEHRETPMSRTENVKTRCGSSISYLSTDEDGMTVWGSGDSSRGYYSGEAHMRNEKELDLEKASKFLCTEYLNEMLNQCYDDMCLHLVLQTLRPGRECENIYL